MLPAPAGVGFGFFLVLGLVLVLVLILVLVEALGVPLPLGCGCAGLRRTKQAALDGAFWHQRQLLFAGGHGSGSGGLIVGRAQRGGLRGFSGVSSRLQRGLPRFGAVQQNFYWSSAAAGSWE